MRKAVEKYWGRTARVGRAAYSIAKLVLRTAVLRPDESVA